MTDTIKCPHCEHGAMTEYVYEADMKVGRRVLRVQGLHKFLCTECEGDIITRAQLTTNKRALDDAITKDSAGCVKPEMLRQLRVKWSLTQKAISQFFGAGESSFAKWESGQTELSTPAALLIRCATELPGVMEFLADLRGQHLESTEIQENEIRNKKTFPVALPPYMVNGVQVQFMEFGSNFENNDWRSYRDVSNKKCQNIDCSIEDSEFYFSAVGEHFRGLSGDLWHQNLESIFDENSEKHTGCRI